MKLLRTSIMLIATLIVVKFCCYCSAAAGAPPASGSPTTPPSTTTTTGGKTVLTYYETANSDAALRLFYTNINQMSTDTYAVSATGALTGTAPSATIAFATQNKITSFVAISNWGATGFDPTIAHAIASSASVQSQFISNILSLLPAQGYAGVNIDFESLNPSDRAGYSSFIANLSQQMHAAGYTVIVSVPAEQADNPTDPWIGAFDYKALGQSADVLQVMTYDENGPWGPPGPVAGNDWVLQTVQFAITVVSPQKLSLGLPADGYDWNLTAGTGVQLYWNQIPALLTSTGATVKTDATSGAPYFDYTAASDGSSHEVWYEDPTTVTTKAKYAVTYNLLGVSEFALGYEDQNFWNAVKQGLQP